MKNLRHALVIAALTVSGCVTVHRPALQPTPPVVEAPLVVAPEPEHASAGESGWLHLCANGLAVCHEDGTFYQWAGFSDFALYDRYLNEGADAIRPVLAQRVRLGASLLRVLGMADSFMQLRPAGHADYYDKLAPFAQLLAEYGLRLEYVALADAQIIMPVRADMEQHLHRARDALAGEWNAQLFECSNEAFKNLPAATEADAETLAGELCRTIQGPPMLLASGAYASEPVARYTIDRGTMHSRRDEGQWPRGSKDLRDYQDATRVPWAADEPPGAAEVDRPGSRYSNPDDFAWYAATAALEGMGATFHSDAGVLSQLLPPVQYAAAEAFFWALKWVPAEAQVAPYQRGGDAGTGGIGEMPIEHDDAQELRSFCKPVGGFEYCVQIRTSRAHATPRDGWVVESEPRPGFVRLTR